MFHIRYDRLIVCSLQLVYLITHYSWYIFGQHEQNWRWTSVNCSCCNSSMYTGLRADSRLAPSQWETALQCNAVSHWLGANLESTLSHICAKAFVHSSHWKPVNLIWKLTHDDIYYGDGKRQGTNFRVLKNSSRKTRHAIIRWCISNPISLRAADLYNPLRNPAVRCTYWNGSHANDFGSQSMPPIEVNSCLKQRYLLRVCGINFSRRWTASI